MARLSIVFRLVLTVLLLVRVYYGDRLALVGVLALTVIVIELQAVLFRRILRIMKSTSVDKPTEMP